MADGPAYSIFGQRQSVLSSWIHLQARQLPYPIHLQCSRTRLASQDVGSPCNKWRASPHSQTPRDDTWSMSTLEHRYQVASVSNDDQQEKHGKYPNCGAYMTLPKFLRNAHTFVVPSLLARLAGFSQHSIAPAKSVT
jgi:hypothetical protein